MSDDTVFSRAADVIRERGLARGVFEDETGAVCMLGALNVAKGLPANVTNAITDEEHRLLRDATGSNVVSAWSDSRDLEDVVLALKRAHVEAGGS